MSQVNTQQMGRMVAAGIKTKLDDAIGILAELGVLHIIDYDGTEDGFTLGSPAPGSEEIGRDLVKARAAASIVSLTTSIVFSTCSSGASNNNSSCTCKSIRASRPAALITGGTRIIARLMMSAAEPWIGAFMAWRSA